MSQRAFLAEDFSRYCPQAFYRHLNLYWSLIERMTPIERKTFRGLVYTEVIPAVKKLSSAVQLSRVKELLMLF